MIQYQAKFRHLTVSTLVVFGGLLAALIEAGFPESKGHFPVVLFFCGACGAVINNYRRISALSGHLPDLDEALKNPMVSWQFYISPLIGGVFGTLLWMGFFSGILVGPLFPKINGTSDAYESFHNLLACTKPASYADAAKGLVWAFLAGYSERFIPNILDKLGEQEKGPGKKTEANPSSPAARDVGAVTPGSGLRKDANGTPGA